jgi:hypothetical protein
MMKCMKSKLIPILLMIMPLSQTNSTQLYRCTDVQGRTAYQDIPCESGAKQQVMDMPGSVNTIHSSPIRINNLVKNYNFEEGFKYWEARTAYPGQYKVSVQDDSPAFSSAVLTLQADSYHKKSHVYELHVKQCIPLTVGGLFSVGAKVNISEELKKPFASRLNVYWHESVDCTSGGQFGGYLQPKNKTGWQDLKRVRLKSSLSTKAVEIQIVQNAVVSEEATAYWDDITFVLTERRSPLEKAEKIGETFAFGENYIKNPHFEYDSSDWGIYGWPAEWVNKHGYLGVLKVTAESSEQGIGRAVFSQCINFGKNKHFTMGIRFKSDSKNTQSGSGSLRAVWYKQSNCLGESQVLYHTRSKEISGWQKLAVKRVTAPEGALSVRYEAGQSIAGAGVFSAYWDEAYFYKSY